MRPLLLALACAALAAAQSTDPLRMSAADAERIEEQVKSNPDDLNLRSVLLRYYFRAGANYAERFKPLRRDHIVWLIEHHPEAMVLSESAGTLDRSGHALADWDAYAEAEN